MRVKKDVVAFVGMGAFGTAIAYRLDITQRYKITFLTKDASAADKFNTSGSNPRCFQDAIFKHTTATTDILELTKSDCIFLTVASQEIPETCKKLAGIIKKDAKIILCSKGISEYQPFFYTKIIKEILGKKTDVYVFSGPNFADEIVRGDLSISTLAGQSILKTKFLSLLFRGTNIKIEVTNDVFGVQIFGAMKNVMAISVGILEGLGFGKNRTIRAVMHLVTEIQKLNKAYGAKRQTAYLSAGIGDIMLTCFDDKSRNKKFGKAIGAGHNIEELLQENLVEGYYAVKAIRSMSHRLKRFNKNSLAYINALYEILYNKKPPLITLNSVEEYHKKTAFFN